VQKKNVQIISISFLPDKRYNLTSDYLRTVIISLDLCNSDINAPYSLAEIQGLVREPLGLRMLVFPASVQCISPKDFFPWR
jgi:hypothetical protein